MILGGLANPFTFSVKEKSMRFFTSGCAKWVMMLANVPPVRPTPSATLVRNKLEFVFISLTSSHGKPATVTWESCVADDASASEGGPSPE
eukprot:9098554-Pyramimonas_sp.AAC.1